MSINFISNLGKKSNVIDCRIITQTGKKLRCKSIWANYNSVPTKIWEYVSKTNRYLLIPYSDVPYLTSDFMFFNAGNISYIDNGNFGGIKKIMYCNNKYYTINNNGEGGRINYFLVENNDILLGRDNLFEFVFVDNIEHYENNIFVTGKRLSDNRTCTFYSNNSIDWAYAWHLDVSQGNTDLYLTHMVESNDYLIGFDIRTESIYRINKSNLYNYNWEKMTDKLFNTRYTKYTISHSNMGKIDNTIYLTLCDNGSRFRNYYSVDDGETWNLFNDTIGFKKICFGNNFAIGTLVNKGYLCKITPTISLDYIDYPTTTPETLNYTDNTFFICGGNRIFCSIDGELWDERSSPDGLINIIYKL